MRIEYPGAIYHVLSRGDRREAVFLDDGDCHDFLKTLVKGSPIRAGVNRQNAAALNFFIESFWAAKVFFTGRIRSLHFARMIPVRFR
jgi:hypothetical protein